MHGIYSLIWTICHKMMWFYRNAALFHIIFIVTHGEIFSHLGHTGPLTVNKMALLSMYRWRWRHIHAFIGRNMIALRVQRFAAGANIICLTYATDWWAVIGPVIHGESKSQATWPGAARTIWVYFTLCQQSTPKSQNSGFVLYWRFWPNWWSEKIWAGNSPKPGCALYKRCVLY